jgi:hypothetical protein
LGGEVTAPDSETSAEPFDVGVAVMPLRQMVPAPRTESSPSAGNSSSGSSIAGFEEAKGGWRHPAETVPILIEKGEDAVRAATEAVAGQIGLAAQRLARSIEERMAISPSAGAALDLDSVSVSFGVTLTVGLQAMFTAQADSSVQVTITLSRPPAGAGSAAT